MKIYNIAWVLIKTLSRMRSLIYQRIVDNNFLTLYTRPYDNIYVMDNIKIL